MAGSNCHSDGVLDHGELRYWLHVVIVVTLARQAIPGEVVAGLRV
jgi:hypothetical protein